MTSSHPRPIPCQWFSWLAAVLDRRTAPRLALLFLGAVSARGRRTGIIGTKCLRQIVSKNEVRALRRAHPAVVTPSDQPLRRRGQGIVDPSPRLH
jgi:hypothetical protein